jgi:DNA-binding ferritin-like protein (Dps family)
MPERAVLLKEIDALPPEYLKEVADFAAYLRQKKHIASLENTRAMEKAAEMMAEEYASDTELTALCALDGEDFFETR